MDYVDEETLVWDRDTGQVQDETDGLSQVKQSHVKASSAQVEFLRHFDKAENQLINISSELLSTTLKISTLPEPEDLSVLREQLIQSINDIKAKGAELTYPVAVIDKLCFLYAVVIDEFIIYTEWGEKRGWENKTLLSQLFGMRNGGELFFSVAEKAVRQPHKLIDLLEVIYIFLNIGFKGQYRDSGNDQLKAFVHQLEQVVSQYRQGSGIHCNIKTKMPKTRKPTRRKRYLVTTLFFGCLIATSIGLTYFWYDKTHPQRARDFNYLQDFSQRYVLSGEVNDIVFISNDQDLDVLPQRASKVELVDTPAPQSLATSQSNWLVQLATFSAKSNAENYLSNLSASKYEPVIDQYKAYYRVIVRTKTAQQAREIKNWFKENNRINAIIVRNEKALPSEESK
ncbi:type IVB secretion system protein IcmH/DotU [Vibrio paucivorans]|uniref:Type IVB secretion system protein IcmH/DotU n=1 Tax=Vibrio paucivorans TaxID=2829489 RepID=A0A9X3HQ22_9VIBR|nr:type IVB secretion system protein IcmH/DotU [Vibrio paucivorans]MCW8332981.1 type IVB secretion system protein IcmH/DotU [Vibrio paucivorans]